MPNFLAALAEQTAGKAVDTAIGMGLQSINDKRQIKQQKKLTDIQVNAQNQMTNYNMERQLELWDKTNYSAQKEQLKKAGLNPGLIYGMGGGGGATTSIATGNVSAGSAPAGGREIADMIGMGLQYKLLDAQRKNIEADTANKQADTMNKPKQGANIDADTENKILQQVISNYAGKEAKDTYERITSPNRTIQAKTYEDELAARQGLAGTIYELWQEGQLKEKSLNEIENIALQNSKTREETKNITKQFDILEENLKGAKLDNVIRDLETRLQTQTGIDKNSPAWMKILGRLFVELFNK